MPSRSQRVAKKQHKTHLNAKPDPRNQRRINDLRAFHDDLFCDIEEEAEKDFRAARFPNFNLNVATVVRGSVPSFNIIDDTHHRLK
jgi:hypothetical protein